MELTELTLHNMKDFAPPLICPNPAIPPKQFGERIDNKVKHMAYTRMARKKRNIKAYKYSHRLNKHKATCK